jgi:hypothetical protein
MTTVPRVDDPRAIAQLRALFESAGYTPENIRAAIGTGDDILSRYGDIPIQLRRLSTGAPIEALIRLFVLNVSVARGPVDAATGELGASGLARLGVVALDGAEVRPLVRIIPHEDVLIASDTRLSPLGDAPADHVVGVNRPSVTLACLTVRRPVRSALDLGTGGGIQAILTARHATQVVATDITERALTFGAFNAALNGVSNIEFRRGSWFAPVEGERFDLVLSNPPYVISPESQYIYRDSGMRGDSASEQVVRTTPKFLAEGGYAAIMMSWVVADPAAADQTASPRRWLEDNGCDAWLLHYRTDDPLTTAANWNEHLAQDPKLYGEAVDRWVAYYRSIGAGGIAFGSVVLRRRSGGPNWLREDVMPAGRVTSASDHILRVFATQDRLRALADEDAFLDLKLALAPKHRIVQEGRAAGGVLVIEDSGLSLGEGLGFVAQVDRYTASIVPRLDGTRTLRQAIAAAAREHDIPADRSRAFVEGAAGVLRRMYETGFLE